MKTVTRATERRSSHILVKDCASFVGFICLKIFSENPNEIRLLLYTVAFTFTGLQIDFFVSRILSEKKYKIRSTF